MKEIIVFCGPTIDNHSAREHLDATYLPPAAGGDIYCASRRRPFAIALIDGVIAPRPTVLHKEILWAMHQGIHVFGASAMGALRAAELSLFGMVGIGKVFEHFCGDEITDDDDVVVAHLGEEHDWRLASDATVNIRATLGAAHQAGVISPEFADCVERSTKARFYPQRNLREVLADLDTKEIDDTELTAVRNWLARHGMVDQMRLDAIMLLRRLEALRNDSSVEAKTVEFHFSQTSLWWNIRNALDAKPDATVKGAGAMIGAVLDELRLDPIWSTVSAAATTQALAKRLAECVEIDFDANTLSSISAQVWHDRGVDSPEELDTWMGERRLDETRLRELVCSEAFRRWGEDVVSSSTSRDLLDQCQLSYEYPRLLARAQDKHAQLAHRGLLDLPRALDISYQDFLTWWAHHRPHLARSQLSRDGHKNRFANDADFRQAMINEYHYVTRCHAREATPESCSGGLCDADIVSTPASWS